MKLYCNATCEKSFFRKSTPLIVAKDQIFVSQYIVTKKYSLQVQADNSCQKFFLRNSKLLRVVKKQIFAPPAQKRMTKIPL